MGLQAGLPEEGTWDYIKEESVGLQTGGFFSVLPWPHLNEAFRFSSLGS